MKVRFISLQEPSTDRLGRPPASVTPLVAAIVLNYKNYDETISCVRALLEQTYQQLKCVIVDNASPNDSVARLQEAFSAEPRVLIVRTPSNGGYASGNNCGAQWAVERMNPKYLLILNPDIFLAESEILARLVGFAEIQDDAAVVSPKVVLPDGFVQGPYERPSLPRLCLDHLFPVFWHLRRKRHQKKYRECRTPHRCFRTIGACMLVRTDSFVRIGMFDERTFMGGEEPILAEKYGRDNMYFYNYPEVMVVHNHSRSSPYTDSIDPLIYYFREYRQADDFSIATLRFCVQFYARFYEPMKRNLHLH